MKILENEWENQGMMKRKNANDQKFAYWIKDLSEEGDERRDDEKFRCMR